MLERGAMRNIWLLVQKGRWLIIALLICGCSPSPEAAPRAAVPEPATARPTAVAQVPATRVPQVTAAPIATAPPAPTAAAALPTAVPTSSPEPTPDPVAGLTIDDLRKREFGEGAIEIGDVYRRARGYTTYRISYSVDGLRLTGLLH